MAVLFQDGYTLPSGDQPLKHARIAHARNWYAGTPSASSTATGYFAAAPDNSDTYEKWKPTSLPATWEIDLGSARDVDYCCIGAHNMGTNGNTLEVQYWNGSAWADLIAATAVTDNSAIFCIFSTENAQVFRIRVTNGTAPEIGVIRFGEALQMPQALFAGHTPAPFGRVADIRAPRSVSGEFIGRYITRRFLQTEYQWTHLTNTWVRTYWGDFQRAVETDPIFIAWRPGSYGDCIYGTIDQPPAPSNMGVKDFMQVGFGITARSND